MLKIKFLICKDNKHANQNAKQAGRSILPLFLQRRLYFIDPNQRPSALQIHWDLSAVQRRQTVRLLCITVCLHTTNILH